MIKLFSYKNLHDKKIQEDTFGITFDVDGTDLIKGYDFIYKKIKNEEYRIATHTGLDRDIIMGDVINIPDDYLEIIDDYEGNWYKRVPIKTLSGVECEIYVKK